MTDILTMLQTLATLRDEETALRAAQDAALPAPLRRALRTIARQFAPDLARLAGAQARLEAQVKTAVLVHGASVKGARLHAVYVSGKASWDDGGLRGFALVHPALLAFRTIGAPSVSLRTVAEKGKG